MVEPTRTMDTRVDPAIWREHWQDEGDAAYLYRALATIERDAKRQAIFRRLADVEARHVALCAEVLKGQGETLPPFQPSARARVMAGLGRTRAPALLRNILLAEEGRELKGYLAAYRQAPVKGPKATLGHLARETAEHAETLGKLLGREGEPWHRMESSGYLRNVVYGFNDGLTANFGLIMGIIGAEVAEGIVVISGIAGLIADALSMGSSGYLAAKSEQEVYAHEVAMEREEIRLMPEVEQEELALLYEMKGMTREEAVQAASRVMADPETALTEKTREELGIVPQTVTPLREGAITGVATGFGALIPILPFFLTSGPPAVWTSIGISMLSHFGVGAARSFFTGRGIFRSGLDMFLVGLGVALVAYFVGWLITDHF
ncbi:MAG: VIT1/CCC1 transporter family protein [Candidatus Methylomirabilales bacterium]